MSLFFGFVFCLASFLHLKTAEHLGFLQAAEKEQDLITAEGLVQKVIQQCEILFGTEL